MSSSSLMSFSARVRSSPENWCLICISAVPATRSWFRSGRCSHLQRSRMRLRRSSDTGGLHFVDVLFEPHMAKILGIDAKGNAQAVEGDFGPWIQRALCKLRRTSELAVDQTVELVAVACSL